MSHWIKAHPFTSIFGSSLIVLYFASFTGAPIPPVAGVVTLPAYLYGALTRSFLVDLLPGLLETFWIQIFLSLVVYFMPLLLVDAMAVRFNRTWHLPRLGF